MIPYLHLWNHAVPTFGLMLWLAAVAASFVMDRGFRRAGVTADAVGMVAVAVVAGSVPSATASGASAAFSLATAATASRSSRFTCCFFPSGPGA
jgi:hypothetical protein